LKKLSIAVVFAVVAVFAFTSVASAHTLRYGTAKKLAIKLGKKQEQKDPVRNWSIRGAQRQSAHQLTWIYHVNYTDGRTCTADLVVQYTTKSNGKPIAKAFFDKPTITCE
jgi:hypothetical protein